MDKKAKINAGFIGDIREEMKKVTWPSRQATIKLTITVFIISLIVGFYVGIIDILFAKILEILTQR